MARKTKLGDRVGVSDWQALETAGDVRRFLRWCILSTRSQSLESKDAAILGQLGNCLLKTIQVADLETRLTVVEKQIMAATQQQNLT